MQLSKISTWLTLAAVGTLLCLPVAAQETPKPIGGPVATSAPAPTPTGEIPVSKIVLFTSGVGYFQHDGSVEDVASTTLMFRADEMNDVLKSMLVMDEKGSGVHVTYAQQTPLLHALKSFGVDISGDPSYADLLKQLRGAGVTLMAPDKIEGKVLSVEAKTRQVVVGGAATIITEPVLNLVTDKGIRSVTLDSVQNLTLKDERLQSELTKALELLIASHDTARKPVEIQFAGKGKRSVQIGYIVETPVWKTSYRLDLSGEKPLLQSWAIVENNSDQDWKNVRLSLVSGRPISFIQDLYTPLYLPRPLVVPDFYASLRPKLYDEGVEETMGKANEKEGKDDFARKERGQPRSSPPGMPGGATERPGEVYGGKPELGEARLGAGLQSAAAAAKLGELFNFAIKDPVNLPRQKSAMLPIVNDAIQAEKVSIYNQSVLAKNPLNGVYLVNSTDLKLPAGPITVLDAGSYAGDARVDNLVPGDKRLISYAIDLNMTVDPSQTSSDDIVGIKIIKGSLEIRHLQQYSQTYKIHNKADEKRTLIVEHPFDSQRTLVEPKKFEEKTPTIYRFRVSADKGQTLDFVVKEEHVAFETMGILPGSVDSLMTYYKNGKISKPVADALKKAMDLKVELARLQQQIVDRNTEQQQLANDQDRLRRNISTVGKDTEQGKKYLAKLDKAEDDIDKLREQIAGLHKDADAKQKELEDYLKELNVE